jgi:16S rRNA (cytosine1402-N4)-methyltransferase
MNPEPASAAAPRHISVLATEVLAALDPCPGQIVVDCTVGAGGHARQLAERVLPGGRLIGLDRDAAMLSLARSRLEGMPATLVHTGFGTLRQTLDGLGIGQVDAVLADLGVCSDQLEDAERGLSFNRPGPLDMRLDREGDAETAADLLARLGERDLADLFFHLGEERYSRRIARKVVEERERHPLETTEQLAEIIRRSTPPPPRKAQRRRPMIDPATRVFQALRIAVNDELIELDRLLAALPGVLRKGGVAAVISFHSLEDRRVKLAFRDRAVWQALTRKPVQTSDEEVLRNPRARSARLRAARLGPPEAKHGKWGPVADRDPEEEEEG